jgi:hypothetical protein
VIACRFSEVFSANPRNQSTSRDRGTALIQYYKKGNVFEIMTMSKP